MPRRRRRRNVLWRDDEVPGYGGTEFGFFIPDERSSWIWGFEPHRYYRMFDIDPDVLGFLSREVNVPAWWAGVSVSGNAGVERVRMHVIAGCYEDQNGHRYPLWWCCEVLGAYVVL